MTERWLVHAEHATRIVNPLVMEQPETICCDARDNTETLLYLASFIETSAFQQDASFFLPAVHRQQNFEMLGDKLYSFYLGFQSNQ